MRNKQAKKDRVNSTSTSSGSEGSTGNNPSSQRESKEDEVEEDIEAPKPCKNHSPSIRCFRCLVGSRGKKVKRVGGNVFGFAN